MKLIQLSESQFVSLSKLNWCEVYEDSMTLNFDVRNLVLVGETFYETNYEHDSLYVNLYEGDMHFDEIRNYLVSCNL